ncbi:MAG: hypothetical protein O2968_22705, partial [Acidobacteria bacterium]|nr:hypothetical protein [Acidobacteriota bacterium]
MDLDKFKAMATAPGRTRADLETIRSNAMKKGAEPHVRIVERILDERFPQWRGGRRKSGGATPTTAMFRGEEQYFPTAKDAYRWLIDLFIRAAPHVLRGEEWQREFVSKRNTGSHFSRELRDLYRDSPHLASDPNFYTRVGDGWFANRKRPVKAAPGLVEGAPCGYLVWR